MIKFLVFIISLSSLYANSEINWSVQDAQEYLGYTNYTDSTEINSDESWAILAYGFTDETDYQDINGFMRYGESYELYNQSPKSVKKLIQDIKAGAQKLPKIPQGVMVYRGFKLSWRKDKCFQVGETLIDKAFISTTLSKRVASHFAFRKESGKGAFLTLTLKSKQTGILITENNEDEILLMPSRKILITKAYEKEGKCYAFGDLE